MCRLIGGWIWVSLGTAGRRGWALTCVPCITHQPQVKHFNMSYDVIEEEDELEKALVFEEERARAREAAAQAQGGA